MHRSLQKTTQQYKLLTYMTVLKEAMIVESYILVAKNVLATMD